MAPTTEGEVGKLSLHDHWQPWQPPHSLARVTGEAVNNNMNWLRRLLRTTHRPPFSLKVVSVLIIDILYFLFCRHSQVDRRRSHSFQNV